MAEKESTQGRRLSLEDQEEQKEKYKSLYFRVATNTARDRYPTSTCFTYEWHAINFSSSNRCNTMKLPATLQKMPPNIPESAIAVPFYSQIYLVGGENQYRNRTRSANMFSFDTTRPDDGWKECHPMIIGRKKPSSVAFDGKIYVFGGKNRDVYPEAEVFDPLVNKWDPLRQPPWNLIADDGHPLNINKQLIVYFSEYLFPYNVEADSWTCFQRGYKSGIDVHVAAVADGVIYWYSVSHKIYGFDLVNLKWFSNPVVGLEKENLFPPDDNKSDDNKSPVWLLHLGCGKLCLVWYALSTAYWRISNITVYCTTFRVSKCDNEAGEVILVATIESSALYHVSGSYCADFIAL